MDDLMKQLREGIAWLDKLQTAHDDVAFPDNDVIAAMAAALRLNIVADAQRDPNAPIPEAVTVKLKNPHKLVAGEGVLLDSLTFRTPSFGEIKKFGDITERKGGAASVTNMMVVLSEDQLTTADVDKLKAVDAARCAEAFEPFLGLADRKKPG